ncbi:conserved hypothetical protein (plasmid) [Rippkaea orientalis PCC 8801]|uniref:DUF4351 domain-containing protein n=1 Tax=Rippkaea orientalis (strain PCC 8801 / RF-1) TaxID=41431 RepID=B7K6I4_RIPO1|nr:DUF4351 domain-containing protein [Rippkaea orientalis]ACK68406.1 conserved hypothetical protein [Rippkaea orientalis PCC 8801]
MKDPSTSFDSPWKDIVEAYLPDFMAFFFPDAYEQINWEQGFEFLDKELGQVVRDAQLGKRFVDKLVKVYRRSGEETWVLIHLEIQSQYEAGFAERIYVYQYRIYDRYRRKVASLVVLGDESPTWKPSEFGYEIFGVEINYRYRVVKLLDLGQDWEALSANENPFATVVMAHLKAGQTKKNRQERLQWKLSLTRQLYQKGYLRQDVINLFRFIDWILSLPDNLESEFWSELRQYEEEQRMPYITSVERLGRERGREEGRLEGMQREAANMVLRQLNRRLGQVSPSVEEQIRQLRVEQLEDLGVALLEFQEEADLLQWLAK